MELVYLWVEDYKNIKNQGFNFSPRFKCHYDENINELTIDENRDYVSIFPENINVTAIVGENGSGKSSIFEYLYRLIKFSHEILEKQKQKKPLSPDWIRWQDAFNCILVVSIKGELYVIGRIVAKEKQIIFSDSSVNNLMSFYGTNEFETEWVLDTNNLKNFANLIGNEIELNSSVLWIDYSFGIPYLPYDSYLGYEEDYFEHSVNQRFFIEPNKIYNRDKAINIRVEEEKNTKRILNYFFNQKDSSSSAVDFFTPNILELRINFERLGLSSAKSVASKTIEELNSHYINLYRDNSDYVIEVEKAEQFQNSIGLLDEILDLNTKYEINHDLRIIDINIDKLKSIKHLDLLLDVLSYAPRYLMLDLIRDENEMRNVQRFSTLSSGEKGLLKIIGNLDYLIKKTSVSSIILLLDEIEIYLHPEWQRKFLYYIIPILEAHKAKQFFCFIATHSPFVISDLQKDNIIILSNGKQDVLDIQQTFGANIHTLLSHGFFMKDGLMGEFAKSKINEIIEFFNSKNNIYQDNKEKLLKIINIIGEPFLKEKLLFMYNEKYPKTNEEKIAELEAEIKRLKNG